MTFDEATVEDAALSWFGHLGYAIAHGLNFSLKPPVKSTTSGPNQVLEVEA